MKNFIEWMRVNDTPENAEKYFHYTNEDMFNEYLNELKGLGAGGESLKEKFIDSASNNKTNTKPMEQLIGGYKEFIIIERTALDELKSKAIELLKVADNDTSKYYEAMAIMDSIKFIKERNIYNRDFQFKK